MSILKRHQPTLDDYQYFVDAIRQGDELALSELPDILYLNLPQDVANDYIANGGPVCSLVFNRDDVPQQVWNQRAQNGFSLSGIPKQNIENIPQEIVNERVSKGYGELHLFTSKQIDAIPQEAINQRAKIGGSLRFSNDRLSEIPFEDIVQGLKTGSLLGFDQEQLENLNIPQEVFVECAMQNPFLLARMPKNVVENLPQSIIDTFVSKYGIQNYSFGNLQEIVSPEQYENISQQAFNNWAKNGHRLDGFDAKYFQNLDKETFDQIPEFRRDACVQNGTDISFFDESALQKYEQAFSMRFENGYDMGGFINKGMFGSVTKRALNGGDLKGLPESRISELSQEIVDEYVKKGGNIFALTDKQRENISQQAVEDRANIGASLFGFDTQKISKLSPVLVEQYVVCGNKFDGLLKEQIESLPQKTVQRAVERGASITRLSYEQIECLPQHVVNDYVSRGGSSPFLFSQEQVDAIPQEVLDLYEQTTNMKKSTQENEQKSDAEKILEEQQKELQEKKIVSKRFYTNRNALDDKKYGTVMALDDE